MASPYFMDVSENRIGRGGTSASGEFGDIPQEMVDRRYEATAIIEDQYELNAYHRDMLKHQGPDPALFEEEQTRRDNNSTTRLNIRHAGSRSTINPYHPEAFLELTDRDPRGTQTDPDIRKMVEQSRFRGKYVRFYPDSDYSVPESGRSDAKIINDKRNMFYWAKDKIRVFSTSHDNRAAGRPLGAKKGRDIENVTFDGQIVDLNTTRPHFHRGDKTTILSNYTPMGWYNTTDHEFSIAQYGRTNRSFNAGDIDLRGAKDNAEVDTPMIEFRGSSLPKAMVQHMKRGATEGTERMSANQIISAGEHSQPRKRKLTYKAMQPGDTKLDHDVVASIVTATKNKDAPRAVSALGRMKRASTKSARDPTTPDTNHGVKSSSASHFERPSSKLNRKTNINLGGRELVTKDYSGIQPVITNNWMGEESSEREDQTNINMYKPGYRATIGIIKQNLNRKDDYDGDLDITEFGTSERQIGQLENKSHTREIIDIDHRDVITD